MNGDEKWQNLLARSTPTFTGEATPPFGFITSTLARLMTEKRLQEEAERIGWRAVLAALFALVLAAAVTWTVEVNREAGNDFDPGIKKMVQMDNIPLS